MNNTLANGLNLLETMASDGREYTVKELASRTSLPASNVCRLLKTLVASGYLQQDPKTRQYRVGLRVLTLSNARLASLDLRRVGHAFAARLCHEVDAPVYLSAPMEGRSVVVDVMWPSGYIGDPHIVVGALHSVTHSACGKVCAAYADAESRAGLAAALAAVVPPERLEDWDAEFEDIRNTGFARRLEGGLAAAAAPIFHAGGNFAGAIGAVFEPAAEILPGQEQAIRMAATGISFALGQPVST
ncbi:MAG: IclR family transcriptional regulator [Kiritimatiellia bacterium]